MKQLFLILFILSLVISSCNDSKTQENISISDMFLALPDSLEGSVNEKQQMLEGGTTLDTAEMDYDVEKYPNGIAVVKGKYLYLYDIHADGVWEMSYFDSNKSDNEKLVLITSSGTTTYFLHAYKFLVKEKCFEKVATNLSRVKYNELINKEGIEQKYVKAGRNTFNNVQETWGNQFVYYDLSEVNNNDNVNLRISGIIMDIAEIPWEKGIYTETTFPFTTYHWNGNSFVKEAVPNKKN